MKVHDYNRNGYETLLKKKTVNCELSLLRMQRIFGYCCVLIFFRVDLRQYSRLQPILSVLEPTANGFQRKCQKF